MFFINSVNCIQFLFEDQKKAPPIYKFYLIRQFTYSLVYMERDGGGEGVDMRFDA